MKNYNEMADSVLQRVNDYEKNRIIKKEKIKKIAVPVICTSLCVVFAAGFYFGRTNINKPNDGNGVFVPAIEIHEKEESAASMAHRMVVFNGNVYTDSTDHFQWIYGDIEVLTDKFLGNSINMIDEWSDKSFYEKDFYSTDNGEIYSVKGYDTDFRLIMKTEYEDENGNKKTSYSLMERLNGISLNKGGELFGDRLRIKDNIKSVKFLNHNDWDNGIHNYKSLDNVSDENINAFIDELYAGEFEYAYKTNPEIYDTNAQVHIYIELNDGTTVTLRLIDGGYVGYDKMPWFFVKIPGDIFNIIFNIQN